MRGVTRLWEFAKPRAIALTWAIPPWLTNYVWLYLAGSYEIRSVFGFGIIFVGDVISTAGNLLLINLSRTDIARYGKPLEVECPHCNASLQVKVEKGWKGQAFPAPDPMRPSASP